ncbi:hypothetical protein H5410_018290 [Solanum commersonii]|uniref:Uncharacterized protein n=1 Tax=Solanum commersonii TaxID=4109 RepID=A0A9J6A2D5_SOLCO|nr:hypothetical protein H5410_018290 [Solanum commersonii]
MEDPENCVLVGPFLNFLFFVCPRGAQMATLSPRQKEQHSIHQAHMECTVMGSSGGNGSLQDCRNVGKKTGIVPPAFTVLYLLKVFQGGVREILLGGLQ